MMETSVRLVLEPSSSVWGDEDYLWDDAITLLWRELEAEVGRSSVLRMHRAVPGTKGSATSVVLALALSEDFAIAAAVIESWLSRAKDRRISISSDLEGVTRSVTLSSAHIDHEGGVAAALAGLTGVDGRAKEG